MSNHIIEQIIAHADILKIIGRHVELKRSGNEFKGCCPFHGEKTASFYVSPAKGLYNCFGCGAKGNALTFLKEYENLTAGEALQELSRQTGIDLPKEPLQKRHTYQRRTLPKTTKANTANNGFEHHFDHANPSPNDNLNHNLNVYDYFNIQDLANTPTSFDTGFNEGFADFTDYNLGGLQNFEVLEQVDGSSSLYDLLQKISLFYQQQLTTNAQALGYFKQRGLTDATIAEFGLGYAPQGWQHLEQAFPRDIDGLKMLGLVRTSQSGKDFDLLRHRVIFPIRDNQGRVIGFAGRSLNDEDMPKYINSSDSPVFHKQHVLYGLYEGRKAKAKDWLVVEGYMDVISLHQAGVYGAVASMGTAIATSQIEKLLQLNPVLTLSFDGDNAGQKASWRAMEVGLPALTDGKELRFLSLPDNHDPDSFVRTFGAIAMQQQIANATPLSQYVFLILSRRHDINLAEGRAKINAEVFELTKKLPKGSYSWLLREDIRNRMGLGKRKQATVAQDALLNFVSNLTPTLVLQLCFLYQPEILGEKINDQRNQALIQQIFSLSQADQVAFFAPKKLTAKQLHDLDDSQQAEKLAQHEAERQQKTAQHLANHPITPPTWVSLFDDNTCLLVDYIQQIQSALVQLQTTLQHTQPPPQSLSDAVALSEYQVINAKAHFILAGLPYELQQTLMTHWANFFVELSSRAVVDISVLSMEILTRQIIDTLQRQVKLEKNLVNKQYYNKQMQVINQWYQNWLQQKEE
ncbi:MULTISPECIES: DNA primase [unclassified Moraxella]|uniref:DNA primase n=1 Tax=unclassified Moraxella TaxID=2685852 RepID=UPI003AF69200